MILMTEATSRLKCLEHRLSEHDCCPSFGRRVSENFYSVLLYQFFIDLFFVCGLMGVFLFQI